jgi:surfactin family lipopeptide synthetase A
MSDRIDPTTNPDDQRAGRLAGLSVAKRALLELRLAKEKAQTGAAIPRGPIAGPAPLSYAQQRLWLLDQLSPGTAIYNVTRAMRLRGELDEGALRRALESIVARHEILRTVYALHDGNPVQVVKDAYALEIRREDLHAILGTKRDEAVERLLGDEVRRPFDLANDQMLRATLLQLGDREHILLLVSHHIASDGWSKGVMFRELATLYEAFSAGQPSPLTDLPIQYANFAVWQLQQLRAEALQAQLASRKERLAGAAVLEFPLDRPRPPVQSYRGAKYVSYFPEGLTRSLVDLGRREGTTMFQSLLAGFQALLARYTRQDDIVVGTLVSGRNRPETEGLIGCFTNTLVLRGDLSGDPTVRDLLRRARRTALDAFDCEDVPFEKFVEELLLSRDASRSPLFQVAFLLDPPSRGQHLPGLELEPFEVDVRVAKNDLTLSMNDEPRGLRVKVEYNTDLFDEPTIMRMVGHFGTLLEAMAEDPGRRLSALPVLTRAERDQILFDWNATGRDYSREYCVHQLFEAQAARTPNAVAVACGEDQLTYSDLNQRANRLAHCMRARGIGPEVMVGVALERSPNLLVALLGILKAGGAYLPLDPSYPVDRLAFMLEDSGAPLLVTQRSLAGLLPTQRVQVLELDQDVTPLSVEVDDNPDAPILLENLAYVIYTSGSTGRPKGVQVSHGALANFLESMRHRPGLSDADRLLAVTSLSFDIAGLELFLPLIVGARLEILGRENAADGNLVRLQLERSAATVLQATPATWRLLVEAGWREGRGLRALCGGEALPRDLADRILGAGATLWNMYGPTETTIWSLIDEIKALPGPISLGRPIANTRAYILDPYLNPVPVGVPGELFLGGDGLARGYRGRPDLTAERFLPDPFAASGARMYRTGDLVRYRAAGCVEFLGRLDFQVKVRGFRIELGEVEAALLAHPAVRGAVAAARDDPAGESRLVAYLICGPQPPTATQLRIHLKERLPDYMIPAAFVTLDEFPMTPNGKVDRRVLPDPNHERPEQDGQYVAPHGPVEEALALIWAEVLHLERVGAQDNFFALGGNSLQGTRLMARVRQAFRVDVPLLALFEGPTVADLALVVIQARAARKDADRIEQLLKKATLIR